jgi:2-polyprenyl-3-methyl-5-hydroxy-6-metoxy-1,4-benzoquinol methylase
VFEDTRVYSVGPTGSRVQNSVQGLTLDAAENAGPTVAYTIEDQRRMSRAKNYFAWQGRLVRPEIGRRVIEVGCGVGNFTEMLLDREVVIAVDKQEGCVEHLRRRYSGRQNVRAFTLDATDDDFSALERFHADSCVCLNVLEHIQDDTAALKNMSSVLTAGGAIVLIVPAFAALYGPIDKNLGHYRRYTRSSMARLAASAGLRIEKARYMNAIGFFGWWANSHIFKKQKQSERQIEAFDKCAVPLVSRMEQVVAPPFGQSLFAVLQKP